MGREFFVPAQTLIGKAVKYLPTLEACYQRDFLLAGIYCSPQKFSTFVLATHNKNCTLLTPHTMRLLIP